MSGNIHFEITGSNHDFKQAMNDTRKEIRDVEGSVDDLKSRLHDALSTRDFLGLKEAAGEAHEELENLGQMIVKVGEAIKEMPDGSAEQKAALEILDALNVRYAELATSIGHVEKAIVIMAKSLMRLGVVVGGVAVLVGTAIKVYRKLTEECRMATKAIEDGFNAVHSQAGQWLADYQKAQALWKSAQGDVDKLNTILEEHREILEASGISINDINDGDTAFITNTDEVVAAIMKRATALGYEQAAAKLAQQAADEYMNAELANAKREEKAKSNPFFGGPTMWAVRSYEGELPSGFVQNNITEKVERENEKRLKEAEKENELRMKVAQRVQEMSLAAGEEAKKLFEAIGLGASKATEEEQKLDGTLKETSDALQQYAAAVEKFNAIREKNARATAREKRNVQDSIEDANIEAMRSGMEKEEALRKLRNQRELRDVEDQKENYIRAVTERARAEFEAMEKAKKELDGEYQIQAFDPSSVKVDTSAYDTLYNSIKEKQKNDLIVPLLDQYRTYEDQRKDILARGSKEISQLLGAGYANEAAEARRKMKRQLENLDRQYGDAASLIFGDPERMNIVQVQKAISLAELELAKATATPQSAKDNADYIDNLLRAIDRLKVVSNDFSLKGVLNMLYPDEKKGRNNSLAERMTAIREAWDNMSAEDRWKNVGGWVSGIAGGLQKAAESMERVAEASGDSRLADAAENLSMIAQTFSAAGQGAAQGGWIGAIIGGVTNLLSQTFEAITASGVAEAENVTFANDWERALRNVNTVMQEISGIFGSLDIARGREGMRAAIESLRAYDDELTRLTKKYDNYSGSMYESGGFGVLAALFSLGIVNPYTLLDATSSEYKAYEEAVKKGYSGLQNMMVKTKNVGFGRLFGAHDQYTALGDLYPELFDESGQLVIENAKKLLKEVDSKLDKTQRKEIQNLIDLKEAYDEAIAAVDDSIEGIFGSLSADITDVIWDSVMNGTDAWENFKKVGSDAIAVIGKQLIQEMVTSEYLEQFRDRMRAAYGLGDASATQAALRDIVGNIFSGMQTMLDAGSVVAQEYKDWATAHGFDLSEAGDAGRRSVAKAMTSVSQDSWDVVDGKITNIMMHLLDIGDRFSVVQDTYFRMYETVGVIATHTARLERMDANMAAMRSEMEAINTRGVSLRQI